MEKRTNFAAVDALRELNVIIIMDLVIVISVRRVHASDVVNLGIRRQDSEEKCC